MLIAAFLLCDVAVVSWSAGVASAGQLVAASLAFTLISVGIIVTQYKMRTR
jgi:hypothetical protein